LDSAGAMTGISARLACSKPHIPGLLLPKSNRSVGTTRAFCPLVLKRLLETSGSLPITVSLESSCAGTTLGARNANHHTSKPSNLLTNTTCALGSSLC
jgi:hypothetical protein